MMYDWEKAIAFVLRAEGGYTLDPHDKGGETNFGISKRSYPKLDIKNLTEEKAKSIYQKDYWQFCKCDELPSPLAIAVFDAAVNQGQGAAPRMLQIALRVNVDGVIGDKTIAAAFKSGNDGVVRFMSQRMARYIRTIIKDQSQEIFADNWSDRLMRCAKLIFTNQGNIA